MRSRIALLCLMAAPAAAQDVFTPPPGCTGLLTIQHRSCLVMNSWSCETDAPGEQWIGMFIPQGLYSVRKVDAEFQWLETRYAFPPRVEMMDVPAPDPESITELLANGIDTYDFTTRSLDGAAPERIVGYDTVAGDPIEIDGQTLIPTEFLYENRAPDGTVISRGAGSQYVSETHRLFVLGLSWDPDLPDEITDTSPVEFSLPGETGFMSAAPKFDCGVIDAGFSR